MNQTKKILKNILRDIFIVLLVFYSFWVVLTVILFLLAILVALFSSGVEAVTGLDTTAFRQNQFTWFMSFPSYIFNAFHYFTPDGYRFNKAGITALVIIIVLSIFKNVKS